MHFGTFSVYFPLQIWKEYNLFVYLKLIYNKEASNLVLQKILKRRIRKYLIPFLAVTLILSNFSFAASYMLCKMDDNSKMSCQCSNESSKKVDGISITKHKSSCCELGNIELSNSNILQQVKSENHDNSLKVICTLYSHNANICSSISSSSILNFTLNDLPVYNRDIYTLNSSYLI